MALEPGVEEMALICCPPDDRYPIFNTTSYPASTVCKVIVQFPSNNIYVGSAVMVGPRHALTAGHVIYSASEGGWASTVIVAPGYDNGSTPFDAYLGTNLYSFVGFTEFDDLNYDFGMIEFDTDVGNLTGWLGYAAFSDTTLRSSTLNTAGYPGDLDDGEQMYGAYGPCYDVSARQVYYRGTMDTAGGQSGSGVWVFDGEDRYVVAVHTFGSASVNGGTRVTQDVFDYIEYVKDPDGGTFPEPPPPPPPGSVESLNVYLGKSRLMDYDLSGIDRARLKLLYFFNQFAQDSLLNPIADGITIRVQGGGEQALELFLPPDDPNWRVKGRRKAVWKGYIGETRVRFSMDVVKQTAVVKLDWFDFSVALENPIEVSMLSGNDFGSKELGWFEKRPGLFIW